MNKSLNFYYEREHFYLYSSSFFGSFVRGGRRGLAETLYTRIFFALKKAGGEDPLWLFSQAIVKISPLLYLQPRNRGGAIRYASLPVEGESNKAIHTIICLVRSISSVRRVRGVCSRQVAVILYDASRNNGLAIEQNLAIYKKSLNL